MKQWQCTLATKQRKMKERVIEWDTTTQQDVEHYGIIDWMTRARQTEVEMLL